MSLLKELGFMKRDVLQISRSYGAKKRINCELIRSLPLPVLTHFTSCLLLRSLPPAVATVCTFQFSLFNLGFFHAAHCSRLGHFSFSSAARRGGVLAADGTRFFTARLQRQRAASHGGRESRVAES